MLRTTTTAWRKEMSQRRKVWKEIHVSNISLIWSHFERDGQLIHIFTNITIPGRWLPALSRSVKRSQKSRCRRTEFRIVNWSVWECKGQWGKERIYGPIDRHSHQSIHPGSHGEYKNGIKAGEQAPLGREDGGEVAGKRKARHVCHQHRHCADLATGSEHHCYLSLRVFQSSVTIFLMIYFTARFLLL